MSVPLAKPIDYHALSPEQKQSLGAQDEQLESLLGDKRRMVGGAPGALGMSREAGSIKEVEMGATPFLSKVCSVWPCCMLGACFVVAPRQEVAITHLGVLTRMEKKPGCHTSYPFGRSIRTISTMQKVLNMPEMKVADASGSPVVVSAILNYRVVDSKKALFNVQDVYQYCHSNAQSVLKQTVGMYTYEQLKNEGSIVTRSLLARIAPLLAVAGVECQSFQLNELNYAPEIASGMLKKQQAGALIEARKLIVEGAVAIAQDAVRLLEAGGTTMDDHERVALIRNILTVTCAETDATPTVAL